MMLWQLQSISYDGALFEEKGPTVFEPEPLLYRPKKYSQLHQSKNISGITSFKASFPLEKQITELTRSEASKIIDRIICNMEVIFMMRRVKYDY